MDLTLFFIVFGVASAVVIPLIWKFARFGSHPHLRPRLGEVLLVAIFAFGAAGGAAAGISTFLSSDSRSMADLRSSKPGKPNTKPNATKKKVLDSILSGESSGNP